MDDSEFGERMFVGIYTVDSSSGGSHPSWKDADSEETTSAGKRYCLSTESSGENMWLADADDIASEIVQSISYQNDAVHLLKESQHSLEALDTALQEFNVGYDIEEAAKDGLVPFDEFYHPPSNEAPELHFRGEEGQYRELEVTERMTFLQNIREKLEFEYGDLLEEPSTDE